MPENLRIALSILIGAVIIIGSAVFPFVFLKLPQGVKIAVYILEVVVLTVGGAFFAYIIVLIYTLFYGGGDPGTGGYVAISVGGGLIGALIGVLGVWGLTRVAKAAR